MALPRRGVSRALASASHVGLKKEAPLLGWSQGHLTTGSLSTRFTQRPLPRQPMRVYLQAIHVSFYSFGS